MSKLTSIKMRSGTYKKVKALASDDRRTILTMLDIIVENYVEENKCKNLKGSA